nr:uncharacterized protein LOC129527377 [Gorilla gorilla gorilla]
MIGSLLTRRGYDISDLLFIHGPVIIPDPEHQNLSPVCLGHRGASFPSHDENPCLAGQLLVDCTGAMQPPKEALLCPALPHLPREALPTAWCVPSLCVPVPCSPWQLCGSLTATDCFLGKHFAVNKQFCARRITDALLAEDIVDTCPTQGFTSFCLFVCLFVSSNSIKLYNHCLELVALTQVIPFTEGTLRHSVGVAEIILPGDSRAGKRTSFLCSRPGVFLPVCLLPVPTESKNHAPSFQKLLQVCLPCSMVPVPCTRRHLAPQAVGGQGCCLLLLLLPHLPHSIQPARGQISLSLRMKHPSLGPGPLFCHPSIRVVQVVTLRLSPSLALHLPPGVTGKGSTGTSVCLHCCKHIPHVNPFDPLLLHLGGHHVSCQDPD